MVFFTKIKESIMSSMKSNLKEAAGYVEEETGEALHKHKMAQDGRDLRNEGRVEKGEAPKKGVPGHKKHSDQDDE
jgi:hypothetical protein